MNRPRILGWSDPSDVGNALLPTTMLLLIRRVQLTSNMARRCIAVVDGGVKAPNMPIASGPCFRRRGVCTIGENNLRGTLHLAENTVSKANPRPSSKFPAADPAPASLLGSIVTEAALTGNVDWQSPQLIGFGCRIGKPINRFCGFI